MTDRVVAGTGQGPARVLVVEPNMEGHRFNYARILVAECQHRGIPVTLVTTPTGRADYLAKAGATVPDAWELVTDGTRPGAAELARVSEKVGATTVVVPDGDAMALGLARRPRWRSTADLRILIMRAHAQPGRYPQLQGVRTLIRRAGFAVAEAVPRVTVLTLGSALAVGAGGSTVADPIEFSVTDESKRALQESLHLDADRFWFGIAGWLDARKNIPLVLAALTDAAGRTRQPLGLVLAGRQAEDVAVALRATPPGDVAVVQLDRHLTEAEFDAAIDLMDCMVLAHSNEGPSGILGKAAAARTKVIAAGAKTLAADVARLGPSAQWVPLNVAELSTAAVAAVAQPPAGPVPFATPRDFATALLGLQ